MTRYFTLLLSILMGVMMIDIDTAMASHGVAGSDPAHGWEEPNPDAVWFTTLPPPIHTDVADAITNGTLKTVTTGLRRNKTYYFNLYVDHDINEDGTTTTDDVKFYFADPTKPDNDPPYLTECTVNDTITTPPTGCASAIMKIFSSQFTLCIDASLLHSLPGNSTPAQYLSSGANQWRPRIMGCSDADNCEGKVRGGKTTNGNLVGLGNIAGAHNGACWTDYVTGPYLTDNANAGGQPLSMKAPLYFRFINTDALGITYSDIIGDFTVGVRVTGTEIEN